MTPPTTEDIPAIVDALADHVNTLLAATAVARAERERVDAIQRRILAQMGYGHVDPRHTYRLTDDTAEEYHRRLDAWHVREGFAEAANGHCPALTAESDQVDAENALIRAAERFFGVTNHKLLLGTKTLNGLDARQKYLDLLIGLVVSRPGYRHPMQTA